MQTIETQNTDIAATVETVAPTIEAAAPAAVNNAAAAKRVRAKRAPVTVAVITKPSKPTTEAREAAQRANADASALQRQAAFQAIGAFYTTGVSKPFKSAADRFADINFANPKSPSARQSALMLCLLTYSGGNMRADGTFTRGGFSVPSRIVNPAAKPGDFTKAQPESGCLGNMLGRTVSYVSGPKSGRDQSAAIYKLDIKRALAEIQTHFGDKAANGARAAFEANTKRAAKASA